MTRRAKRWLLGAGGVSAALMLLWWSGRVGEEPTAQRAQSTAPLQWRTGTWQQYDVRVDSSMRMTAGGAGAINDLDVRMSATLGLRTLEAAADSALVGAQLSAVVLEVAGNTDAAMNRALEAPFRVRFSAAGMPIAFEFPAGVGAEQRTILENLVRTFQVTVQAGDDWSARESNAAGSYEALYRRADASRVDKSKRNFVGNAAVPLYAGAEIVSAETFTVEPRRDWIAAMSVDETLRAAAPGRPGVVITNRATLTLRADAQTATAADAWAFAAAPAPAAGAELEPAVPALTAEQALQRIRGEVAALNAAADGRTLLIHRLRDLLRVDATLPAALLAIMQTEELTDRTRADLYLAFELAATEPAQAALTSVIGLPGASTRDAMRAIVALGGVAQPTPATVTALWDTAQGAPATPDGRRLASTATLALGSIGKSLRTAEDPTYAALRARLLSGALGGPTTAEQRANYVHAVGNTGDASLARELEVLLDDPEPVVRRAAALSLGRLDANGSAGALLAHFEGERSGVVRGALAEALAASEATAEVAAEMRTAVRAEADENARYHMARVLAASLESFPANRTVLEELMRSERSRRIRQSVAEALAAP